MTRRAAGSRGGLGRDGADLVVAVDHALGELDAPVEQRADRAPHRLLHLTREEQQAPFQALEVAHQVLGHPNRPVT